MSDIDGIKKQLGEAEELSNTLFERSRRGRDELVGIQTGFKTLDYTLRGFTNGKLYTIGGRPGSGKTSFGTSISAGVLKQDSSVAALYISTELSRIEILEQIVEAYAGVPFYPNNFQHNPDERKRIDAAITAVGLQVRLNLLGIVHYKRLSIELIERITDAHCEINQSTSLVMIDQASRIRREEKNGYTIGTEHMLNDVESLAHKLDVPMVLFSQLNRGADGARPTMADYKWSGAFEEMSHAAILLWKEQKQYGKYHPWDSKIIVAKNRHGTTTDIEAVFSGECHLWEESSKYAQRNTP